MRVANGQISKNQASNVVIDVLRNIEPDPFKVSPVTVWRLSKKLIGRNAGYGCERPISGIINFFKYPFSQFFRNAKIRFLDFFYERFNSMNMPFVLAAINTPREPVTEIPISFAAFLPLISSIIKREFSCSAANEIAVASPLSK